jgi:hypothetical protein
VDLNLDTLKREILDHLSVKGFAVFLGRAGSIEGLPTVLWDVDHYPDYRMFLDVAKQAGVTLVVLATHEFEAEDLDDLKDQLEEIELTREERREYEKRIRDLRIFQGVTCSIELAFDHDGRLYLYEVQPDWYEDFLAIDEELAGRAAEDGLDDTDTLGGYFSKN